MFIFSDTVSLSLSLGSREALMKISPFIFRRTQNEKSDEPTDRTTTTLGRKYVSGRRKKKKRRNEIDAKKYPPFHRTLDELYDYDDYYSHIHLKWMYTIIYIYIRMRRNKLRKHNSSNPSSILRTGNRTFFRPFHRNVFTPLHPDHEQEKKHTHILIEYPIFVYLFICLFV